MTQSNQIDDDELFDTGDIYANRELVTVGYVPDENRIVGRQEEMRKVGQALGPGVEGGPPKNLIIYGKTGAGKSLVAKHVAQRAERRARDNGIHFVTCYVDCSNADTETRVAREMAFSIRDELSPSMEIPMNGIGAAEYYRYLWSLLDDQDVFVVILDEVDKLQEDDVLMQLSRAQESGKTDAHVGVLSVSNKIEYRDRLNKRIDSSLQDREHVFDPYDADELRSILNNRQDAFKDGVLEDGVIELTAALSAQEHGDARKAIDILQEAGELAVQENATTITETHVRAAKERAEINRFKELISGTTTHVKYTLRALALLTQDTRTDDTTAAEDWFRTNEIYAFYRDIVEHEGHNPLKKDSVYRILDEQSFLGITESRHTGGGKGQGSYLEHTLLTDPGIVLEAVADIQD
ncbi:orc1/cdc6 family replication initiation protein [Halosimplex litoreum]|uniref:ORC1-type DNA replication protein n=1 Tax=Halosimplex litoreum TaxID=1198301 RepID=A0A7T3KTU7_9EURY|nr:orc1/cdc6 family replication initiation protein [Halosimplex litoreum]QPV61559.1 orc1/cdc6 family replication initiation protein [Halosimplex litoreum]